MKGIAPRKKLEALLHACKKNLRTVDERMIENVFYFSLEAHKNQNRVSGDNFFNHPYEVALIVAQEIPFDDVTVASALLHDVLEETDFEFDDLKEEFGLTIANIVDGVTKITDVVEGHEVTQAENYRKLFLSMANDIRVIIVKFADRLHNMRTLVYLAPEKQQRIAKETLDIYAGLAHRFGLANIKWELEDLSFKYLHPKDYDELSRAIKSKRDEREAYVKKFIKPVELNLKLEGFSADIAGRPKHLYSIFNKMKTRGKNLDGIFDLFAVRIILDTEIANDCYTVFGIVSSIYQPVPNRFKNYISLPKPNGYQSLHTTVVGPDGRMVEVQIRTKNMHEVAEKGVAAHFKYKGSGTSADADIEHWMTWVREVFEQVESDTSPEQVVESFKLNLFQNEVYVFSPKGELKILPKGATPVDYAFEVHSDIGMHCIGSKVNGKMVPLDSKLKSGDQIEIITSKNQTPSLDWDKFVVSPKAKQRLRKLKRETERRLVAEGRVIFEHRSKRLKIPYTEEELQSIVTEFGFESSLQFLLAVQEKKAEPDGLLIALDRKRKNQTVQELPTEAKSIGLFDNFVQTARQMLSGVSFFGNETHVLHNFAKCCHPIPGDNIIGFVTIGEGIKIHRSSCRNILSLPSAERHRLIEVQWPSVSEMEFAVVVKVTGEDRRGLVNDLTHVISSFNTTNIRSINVDTHEKRFDGLIILNVKDIAHLNRLIEKMRQVKGVDSAQRFEEI